jgi:hypothetical protein
LILSKGYIYVLINPSIQNVVKIGMTTRDPENRVAELSNATGVATPFILVYKEYFENCHLAEKQLHTILEQRNYRVSNNREFFTIPVHEAIKLIQHIKSQDSTSSSEEYNFIEDDNQNDVSQLASNILEEAENYYYGRDGKLEDYDAALKLFKQASKLGAIEAYNYLGDIYLYGFGVNEDIKIALDYFKQGAKFGNVDCYACMGRIYSIYDNHRHKDNASKCWSSYFENIYKSSMKEFYIEEYIYESLNNKWEIKMFLTIHLQ